MSTLEVAAQKLQDARYYLDVFGPCDGDTSTQSRHIKAVFRDFAKTIHPDLYGEEESERANKAFSLLQKFFEEAEQAVRQGTYGKPFSIATLTSKIGEHWLTRHMHSTTAFDMYEAVSEIDGESFSTVVRIAKDSAGEQHSLQELETLNALWEFDDPELRPFLPTIVDDCKTAVNGMSYQVNVFEKLEKMYSLEEVRTAFPNGLDPQHAVWIWRRLLFPLSIIHQQGILHGSVLPNHVMIHPEKHGVVLVNWCSSSHKLEDSEEYRVILGLSSSRYDDWLPDEVRRSEAPSPATDIMMAARCMIYLMGGDPLWGNLPEDKVPKALRAFFKGCLSKQQSRRPQNAYELLKEFDELLERMGEPYHPRRFVKFTMP